MTILISGIWGLPIVGFSQENEKEGKGEVNQQEEQIDQLNQWGEKMDEWGKKVEESVGKGEPIPSIPPISPIPSMSTILGMKNQEVFKETPRFGLYLDDLDFEDAYEKHYPYNYGVLITGVIRGGNADQAGLRKGDIIMEFDGEKARYEDHLISMRNSKHIGDTVEIKFFRNEREMTTQLTFFPPKELTEEGEEGKERKKKLSPGYGGGGFEPVHIDFDFAEVNQFLRKNGFDNAIKDYTLTIGGGGMGNIGKGWFIGGMGAGMKKHQQIPVMDINDSTLVVGQKRYQLDFGFGGVTITKKIPLFTKKLIMDMGIMLGGGSIKLELNQTDGDYTWEDQIGKKRSYSMRFEKKFFAYRPSIGLLVRVKNWFGVHSSVGYFGTYSSDDKWTEKAFDFSVSGASPPTPSGLSYSLGIWFGY